MSAFPPNRKLGLLIAGLLLFIITHQAQASPVTSPSGRTQKSLGWVPALVPTYVTRQVQVGWEYVQQNRTAVLAGAVAVAADGAMLASQGDCWFGWKIVTDPLTGWVRVVPCQDALPPIVPPQFATPRPTLTPTVQLIITVTKQASATAPKPVTPNPATMTAQASITATITPSPEPTKVKCRGGYTPRQTDEFEWICVKRLTDPQVKAALGWEEEKGRAGWKSTDDIFIDQDGGFWIGHPSIGMLSSWYP